MLTSDTNPYNRGDSVNSKISRMTLYRYVQQGIINVRVLPTGRYEYNDEDVYRFLNKDVKRKNVIYGRVSTSKQKKDLDNQIEMLKTYCVNWYSNQCCLPRYSIWYIF